MINRIHNYQIIQPLGKGGMGQVYRARHIRLGHYVAIKVLNKELSDNENFRSRFNNEAKIMANLVHPNIVKVIDFFTTDHYLAIVMEYVDGVNLNTYIKNPKNTFLQRINIFLQVLQAIDYAHQRGVIHRDLKPDNILITKDNIVKILDFGIAKAAFSSLNLTNPGTQLGTPLFMSPEQVKDSKNLDNLTDIYSLGVIFYYITQRKLPYDTASISRYEILSKIVNEPLPPLKYHKEFNHIVQKATQKRPEKRYLTCKQFAEDIIRTLETGKQNIKQNDNRNNIIINDEKIRDNIKKNVIYEKKIDVKKPVPPKTSATKKKSNSLKKFWVIMLLLIITVGGYFGYKYWDYLQPKKIVIKKSGTDLGRIILPHKSIDGNKQYVVFSNNNLSKNSYISTVLVDKNGQISGEQKIYGTEGCEIKNVYKIEDGSGYILGGYKIVDKKKNVGNAWIAKIDNNFNLIWQEIVYPDDEYWSCVYSIKAANNASSVILVGSRQEYIEEIDKKRNQIFINQYSISKGHQFENLFNYLFIETYSPYKIYESVAFDVTPTHDQEGYLVTGYMFTDKYLSTTSKDAFVLKLNNNFMFQNLIIFGGDKSDKFFKITKGYNGNYLLAGFSNSYDKGKGVSWILNLDENLKQVWNKIYPLNNYKNEFLSIKKSPNNSYMLSGYVIINKKEHMRFVNISKNGSIIYDTYIKNNKSENARDFIITNPDIMDYRFIISTGYQKNNDKDILIYKQKLNL